LARAGEIEPGDPRIPYVRATILLQLGRTDEARDALGRALELQPDFAPALKLSSQLTR
jgi:Flp pilus assembly protein TadD